MELPGDIRWDASTGIYVLVFHKVNHRVWMNEKAGRPEFAPVTYVDCQLEIPYPQAEGIMASILDDVRISPEGVRLYDPRGRVLDFDTGELYT